MATTTNYGWTTPDDTALVKDGASAIRTLGTSVDTTTKNLNPSTTLGDIEYRSSTSNTNTRLGIGTSGQALTVVAGAPSWAASPTSVLTTTGDSLYASAANTLARLGIGSTGQVLTVASGLPSWATPSAGVMTLISETVASANSSIDLTSIPSTYTQLLLVWSGIVHSNTSSEFDLRINNSSSSVYADEGKRFGNTTLTTDFATRTFAGDGTFGFRVTGASAHQAASGWFYLDNYASSTKYKTYRNFFSWYDNSAAESVSYTSTGTFLSTTAVTQLNIFRNGGTSTISNNANTSIRLYGIA